MLLEQARADAIPRCRPTTESPLLQDLQQLHLVEGMLEMEKTAKRMLFLILCSSIS